MLRVCVGPVRPVGGLYMDFLYIGCHGGPKLKLMCLGMADVGCRCLPTTEPVHTTPIYSSPKGHEAHRA